MRVIVVREDINIKIKILNMRVMCFLHELINSHVDLSSIDFLHVRTCGGKLSGRDGNVAANRPSVKEMMILAKKRTLITLIFESTN